MEPRRDVDEAEPSTDEIVPDGSETSLLDRLLRRGRVGPFVRLAASVGAGALIVGLGTALGYLLGALDETDSFRVDRVRVSQEKAVMPVFIAGGVWLMLLIFIWRGGAHRRARLARRAVTITVAAIATATAFSLVVTALDWDEFGIAVAAFVLLGLGVVVLVWVPAIDRAERGVYVARYDIRCLGCGYSMVGLREAVCPECGREHTLDQLLGGWRATGPNARHEAPATATAERTSPQPPETRAPPPPPPPPPAR